MEKEVNLLGFKTYVLLDVSNIRSACLKSCNFRIDFIKLYDYLVSKYLNLCDVRYYEGIAHNDLQKKILFKELGEHGYIMKPLVRRAYTDPAIMKTFVCKHCGKRNRVEALPSETKMKSNVDVFLSAEMLKIAYEAHEPTHIILFTCDGDYAEAIKIALQNQNIVITVVATPPIRDWKKNALSIRLKELRKDFGKRYMLNNVNDIRDNISL